MTALGVIPARWASTRFPGKMLAPLCGKPLIEWVLLRARRASRLDALLVATDDPRIRDAVEQAGGRAVMTRSDHPSGTDRIAEAAAGAGAEIIVNIQGDEPMVDPALLDRLVETLEEDASWDMATAASPARTEAELRDPGVVKVVTDREGRALYFSRFAIPFVREAGAETKRAAPLHWRHIGVYGYRAAFLQRVVRTPPCALEEAEKLEQLRALDLGGRIKVLQTERFSIGVDSPGDMARAERAMKESGMVAS